MQKFCFVFCFCIFLKYFPHLQSVLFQLPELHLCQKSDSQQTGMCSSKLSLETQDPTDPKTYLLRVLLPSKKKTPPQLLFTILPAEAMALHILGALQAPEKDPMCAGYRTRLWVCTRKHLMYTLLFLINFTALN